MQRQLEKIVLLFLSALLIASPLFSYAQDTSGLDTLQQKISEKGAELQKIQEQRDSLQKAMDAISASGASIKKDIQTYNTNISQLNLSIKANSTNIEKLQYEIQSLSSQIGGIGGSIVDRKKAIGTLLHELQQKEGEDLFARILRGNSLSQSIAEVQSITTLNSALRDNINDLQDLRNDYSNKIDENKKKKETKEIQKSNLVNLQQIAQDQKAEKEKVLSITKSQEQLYAQQIEELDKKQAEISAVIDEVEHDLRSTFDPNILPLKRTGVLGFPVDDPYITQCYGPTKFAAKAYRSKSHNGLDFGGPIGTPILAVESGVVVKTGNNDRGTSRWSRYQYGKHVVVKHSNNLASLYAHLSKINVVPGQTVQKGDVIGYLGNTGYAFGPHLHLTLLWAPSIEYKVIPPAAGTVPIGVTIDPTDYLPTLAGIRHASDSVCY